MRLLYHCGIGLLTIVFRAGAFLGHKKIKKGWAGRRAQRRIFADRLLSAQPKIWIHAASLGEFEQVRHLLRLLKSRYPAYSLILTFFSPSGYERLKSHKDFEAVFYMPFDTLRAQKQWLDYVQPKLVLFVKYELWLNALSLLKQRSIPVLLVSAFFRKHHFCFHPLGYYTRQALRSFTAVLVQDEASQKTLSRIYPPQRIHITGDTRVDSVAFLPQRYEKEKDKLAFVEVFKGSQLLLVAGSVAEEDIPLLGSVLPVLHQKKVKLLLAPHQLREKDMYRYQRLFNALRYTQTSDNNLYRHTQVALLDTIGLLALTYGQADMVYVGGGFRKRKLHNTLEPAVYGTAIVVGPYTQDFYETQQMISRNAMVSVKDKRSFSEVLSALTDHTEQRRQLAAGAQTYIRTAMGASQSVIDYIEEGCFLTNCIK